MRILFMGTPDFAIPSLRVLQEKGYSIPAVVTVPDKPRGRGQHVSFTPVKEYALKHSIPLFQPQKLTDVQFHADVRDLNPDLIVVVAFKILPKELYTIPKYGAMNLHASLLPKYRGAAPINWAIMNGESETGVTTFFLQEKVDTGSIILQARIRISLDDNAGDVHDKLAEVGAEIVYQSVRLIELDKAQTKPQEDTLASPAPKLFTQDCRIDWSQNAQQIHNRIRGLSPIPTAWTTHNKKVIKIFRSVMSAFPESRPGEIIQRTAETLIVGTKQGAISVLDIQLEGRKKMGIAEFLRGYQISVGDLFE